MPRLSRQMKDTLQTIAFLVVVAVLVVVYIVYPLNRVKKSMGRTDIGDYNADSLPANDPTAYVEAGFTPDTFRVEADGLTTLAGLYILPATDSARQARGTVFLVHDDGADRDAMLPLARLFADSGFAVVACDQRASGRSGGKYRSDGQYEASDLEEVIRYLDLREKIFHPVILVGVSLGADAALLAATSEQRIDRVVALNPYLTSRRMLDQLKQQYGMFWFPFYRTIMWWWYEIRSSYAVDYRGTDDIKPVGCPTLLMAPPEALEEKEYQRLAELSSPDQLEIQPAPDSDDRLMQAIMQFVLQPGAE